jgi:hypothetical protein
MTLKNSWSLFGVARVVRVGAVKKRAHNIFLALAVACFASFSARAEDFTAYFPLTEGNKWSYSRTKAETVTFGKNVRSEEATGALDEEIVGAAAEFPGGVMKLAGRITEDATVGDEIVWRRGRGEAYFEWKNGVLNMHGTRFWSESPVEFEESSRYEPPLAILKSSAERGATWKVGMCRVFGLEFPMTARLVGHETVTVPAGTFADCLKVVYVAPHASGEMRVGEQLLNVRKASLHYIIWHAKNVGIVKEVATSRWIVETDFGFLEREIRRTRELLPGYSVK